MNANGTKSGKSVEKKGLTMLMLVSYTYSCTYVYHTILSPVSHRRVNSVGKHLPMLYILNNVITLIAFLYNADSEQCMWSHCLSPICLYTYASVSVYTLFESYSMMQREHMHILSTCLLTQIDDSVNFKTRKCSTFINIHISNQ